MNRQRPGFVGRVNLLCLLAGFFPWVAMPAVAETTQALPLQLPSTEDNITARATAPSSLHSAELTQTRLDSTVELSQAQTTRNGSTFLQEDQQVEESTSTVVPISLPKSASLEPRAIASAMFSSSRPIDSKLIAQVVESSSSESSPMAQVNSVSQLRENSSPESSSMEQVTSLAERMGMMQISS